MEVFIDGAIKTAGLIFGGVTLQGIHSHTVVLFRFKNAGWFLSKINLGKEVG